MSNIVINQDVSNFSLIITENVVSLIIEEVVSNFPVLVTEQVFNVTISEATSLVKSVNGQVGDVVLDADDITETTNRVFVTPAEKTAISNIPTSTSDLTNNGEDGINPYITLLDLPNNVLSSTITDYVDATLPLAGTEQVLVEQGGIFKKVDVSDFGGGTGTSITEATITETNNEATTNSTTYISPRRIWSWFTGILARNNTWGGLNIFNKKVEIRGEGNLSIDTAFVVKNLSGNIIAQAKGNGAWQDSYATATGTNSHADSLGTANGENSHADSNGNATGDISHADSAGTANGFASHADSGGTANGTNSHADSFGKAYSLGSHADSNGTTNGNFSHASGLGIVSNSYSETVVGIYNEIITAQSATSWNALDLVFSVGIGKNSSSRLTAFSVYKNGMFKFVARALTNITNAVKGSFAVDENGRPYFHNGIQWNKIAYSSEANASAPTFSEIVINAETDGVEIAITGGTYLVYNWKGTTIYRFLSTATNANGYNIEDSFYSTLTSGVLSNKIVQRNQ